MYDENDLIVGEELYQGGKVSFIDLFPDGPVATPPCRILDLSKFKPQESYILAQDELDIFLRIYLSMNKDASLCHESVLAPNLNQHDSINNEENRAQAFEDFSLEISNGTVTYRGRNISKSIFLGPDYQHIPTVVGTWEDDLAWDDKDLVRLSNTLHAKAEPGIYSWNNKLSSGIWENFICWEPLNIKEQDAVANDLKKSKTYSTQDLLDELEKHKTVKHSVANFRRFNISQDGLYEKSKSATLDRTRQSYGNVPIKHALPAVKLHTKYYKPQLSARELRRFHRPFIKLPINETITFSKLKTANVNKNKNNLENAEIYKNARSLSLRDTSSFILFEYSEEFPIILSNFGMGCLLYNYYRKKNDNDEPVLKYEVGHPFVLESVDASPFLGFGDVFPGTSIQAISNNMYKAPVFPQPVDSSLFLLIRHSFCGKTKYFIRTIPYLFAVGQILPLKEVPPPHSRRITQTIKGRMHVSAFRLIKKDPDGLLMYEKFSKIFYDWSELHLKQRLKEFAQFARKGDSRGWWRLKPSVKIPSEEEIRKIVTPEMVCLCQSMLVGQQRLRDIGYGDSDEEEEEESDDLELKLAPWHLTKNFVQASQNKSMIKVYGEGDPSGRGEAFSFLKASMKEPFLRAGESENDRFESYKSRLKSYHRFSFAKQQQIYREEIIRVWNSQLKSLSRTTIPNDCKDVKPSENDTKNEKKIESNNKYSSDIPNPEPEGKYLTIRRLYRNPDGSERIELEVINNIGIINAYLRKMAAIEKQERAMFADNQNATPEEIRSRKRKIVQDQIDLIREKRIVRGHKKRKSRLKHSQTDSQPVEK